MTITIGGVTYVTPREAAQETGVSEATIRNWIAAGAVDTVTRRGRLYVRLGAVRYMRNTSAKVTRSEGVSRVSAKAAAASRAWRERQQSITRPVADRAGEVWEATEENVAVADLADESVTVKALRLGRSYSAVIDRRHRENQAFTA